MLAFLALSRVPSSREKRIRLGEENTALEYAVLAPEANHIIKVETLYVLLHHQMGQGKLSMALGVSGRLAKSLEQLPMYEVNSQLTGQHVGVGMLCVHALCGLALGKIIDSLQSLSRAFGLLVSMPKFAATDSSPLLFLVVVSVCSLCYEASELLLKPALGWLTNLEGWVNVPRSSTRLVQVLHHLLMLVPTFPARPLHLELVTTTSPEIVEAEFKLMVHTDRVSSRWTTIDQPASVRASAPATNRSAVVEDSAEQVEAQLAKPGRTVALPGVRDKHDETVEKIKTSILTSLSNVVYKDVVSRGMLGTEGIRDFGKAAATIDGDLFATTGAFLACLLLEQCGHLASCYEIARDVVQNLNEKKNAPYEDLQAGSIVFDCQWNFWLAYDKFSQLRTLWHRRNVAEARANILFKFASGDSEMPTWLNDVEKLVSPAELAKLYKQQVGLIHDEMVAACEVYLLDLIFIQQSAKNQHLMWLELRVSSQIVDTLLMFRGPVAFKDKVPPESGCKHTYFFYGERMNRLLHKMRGKVSETSMKLPTKEIKMGEAGNADESQPAASTITLVDAKILSAVSKSAIRYSSAVAEKFVEAATTVLGSNFSKKERKH